MTVKIKELSDNRAIIEIEKTDFVSDIKQLRKVLYMVLTRLYSDIKLSEIRGGKL